MRPRATRRAVQPTELIFYFQIEKVSGPVAKATRILHKRKNTLHHENQLFYRKFQLLDSS